MFVYFGRAYTVAIGNCVRHLELDLRAKEVQVITIKAYANTDHAYVVWRPDPEEPIESCLGFALYRRIKGKSAQIVETFVGPKTETKIPAGTHKPSTVWPIQKYMWSDYLVPSGVTVQYQAVAMCGDSFDDLKPGEASDWSGSVSLAVDPKALIQSSFNRGVVSTQWVARQLVEAKGKSLKTLVTIPSGKSNKVRDFLGGTLKEHLLGLLNEQDEAGAHIYASLFELNDPEVLPAILRFGQRAHVVLSDGTHAAPKAKKKATKHPKAKSAKGSKAGVIDENEAARQELRDGHVEVHDRMVTGNHFCHHKFIVFTNPRNTVKAAMVWTGSTNLTYGGVCTQANNGVLIKDAAIADRFLQQWKTLVKEGDDYPSTLVQFDAKSLTGTVGKAKVTAWFAPNPRIGSKPKKGYADHPDLKAARALINGAQEGVLFLVFNPGPRGTLLNDILTLLNNKAKSSQLYIHGVANQDPGGKNPILFVHDNKEERGPDDIVLPGAVATSAALAKKDKVAAEALAKWVKLVNNYWMPEPTGLGMVRVHSKTVVVDPFGKHPVVITGSHNFGPKASEMNDDNLVFIENDPATAMAYAVNIITVYDQYRWRFQQMKAAKNHQAVNTWHGLEAPWDPKGGYLTAKKKELAFWLKKM
jgi:phosphatidylserine/phosphatidylglycerophosphate/cardiolipin synthase-like enzyme